MRFISILQKLLFFHALIFSCQYVVAQTTTYYAPSLRSEYYIDGVLVQTENIGKDVVVEYDHFFKSYKVFFTGVTGDRGSWLYVHHPSALWDMQPRTVSPEEIFNVKKCKYEYSEDECFVYEVYDRKKKSGYVSFQQLEVDGKSVPENIQVFLIIQPIVLKD